MDRLNVRSLPAICTSLTLAVVLVLAGSLASQSPAPTPLTLLSKDGRRTLAVTLVNDQEYVSLDEVAAIFQLAVREDPTGAITSSYKGKTIVLTADQPLASVAGRLVPLPAPPTRAGRRWLVPVEFISRAVALVYEARLDLRKASHLLVVGDVRVPRVTVRLDPVGRLTIDTAPRAAITVTQGRERLLVKFEADAIDVASPVLSLLPPPSSQGPQSTVQSVRVLDATTLAIELGPRVTGYRTTTQSVDAGGVVAIDFTGSAQAPTPAAPAPPLSPEPPLVAGPAGSLVHTITIDPGHGGGDEGVKGPNGAKEKDLTLEIARRLKAAIEARLGLRVVLTRDDDRAVSFDDRVAAANNSKADLFISLHMNASFRKTTSGATIYYAMFGEDALRPAAMPDPAERIPTAGDGSREIDLVRWDFAQARHLDQSRAFALLVQQQFQDRVPVSTRPVDHAPMRALESANMPAVLVELGFLSNPDEEKRLSGAELQDSLVQALSDAIVRFHDPTSPGDAR